MNNSLSLQKAIEAIDSEYKVLGSVNRTISSISPLNSAKEDSISFCSKKDEFAHKMIQKSKSKTIICSFELNFADDTYKDKTLILVQNPRLAFIQILRKYFMHEKKYGISPLAVVSERAEIHPDVFIGPHSYIGDCTIGAGSIIYGNVYIYSKTEIGKNVTIHTGTTIGIEDAFAYERNERGKLIRFPHFGGVTIGDDVDIHAHVNIDRGTFDNTIIGQGTKINRYAHIGHNSVIGKHCQIGGQVFIAGSSKIGDYCELALCSCIRNGTCLGENVMVGMGSVVTKDVEDDWIVYGVPAKRARPNKIPPWRHHSKEHK